MENEIRNTTVYDKDLIIKYNQFYSRSYMKKNFLILGLISMGVIAFMIIQKNYTYAILVGGLIVAYYLLTILMQKMTIKRMIKKSPLIDNPITQSYLFSKNRLIVTIESKSYEVAYSDIKSVVKGQELFLLKSNDNKSYIVDYAGFDTDDERRRLEEFFIIRFNMKER